MQDNFWSDCLEEDKELEEGVALIVERGMELEFVALAMFTGSDADCQNDMKANHKWFWLIRIL